MTVITIILIIAAIITEALNITENLSIIGTRNIITVIIIAMTGAALNFQNEAEDLIMVQAATVGLVGIILGEILVIMRAAGALTVMMPVVVGEGAALGITTLGNGAIGAVGIPSSFRAAI